MQNSLPLRLRRPLAGSVPANMTAGLRVAPASHRDNVYQLFLIENCVHDDAD